MLSCDILSKHFRIPTSKTFMRDEREREKESEMTRERERDGVSQIKNYKYRANTTRV